MSDPSEDEDEDETWEQAEAETAEAEHEPTARRPRRRLLTPLTALLFALLVGAGGFIAGVQVEKSEVSPASGARAGGRLASLIGAASARAGAGAASVGGSNVGAGGDTRAFGGGALGGGATVGQVANVSGSDLYVTGLEGNTVKVLASAAQITKQVSSTVRGVHPGDTVVVQGATRPNGAIQASTVRDSGSSGGGGEPALFGR